MKLSIRERRMRRKGNVQLRKWEESALQYATKLWENRMKVMDRMCDMWEARLKR